MSANPCQVLRTDTAENTMARILALVEVKFYLLRTGLLKETCGDLFEPWIFCTVSPLSFPASSHEGVGHALQVPCTPPLDTSIQTDFRWVSCHLLQEAFSDIPTSGPPNPGSSCSHSNPCSPETQTLFSVYYVSLYFLLHCKLFKDVFFF